MVVSSACATLSLESDAYFMIPHHTGKQQSRDDAGDAARYGTWRGRIC